MKRCNDGAWRFFRPSGNLIHAPAPGNGLPLTHWVATPAANAARGVLVTPRTGATNWRGEDFDCSIAVDALLFRQRKAAAAAAG
jgi:hypothetical protein